MTFNPKAIKFSVPRMNHDKIIGTLSGTINVAAVTSPTNSVSASFTHNTGFNDTCLMEGIYSVDGGATWNDMGAQVPDLSTPSQPVFQTTDVAPTSFANGDIQVVVTNYLNNNTGSTPAKTVIYKLVLFAKPDQKPCTPLPIAADSLKYSSRFNFQKIFKEGPGSVFAAIGASGQTVITHGLGYVPNVRAWIINGTSITIMRYDLENRTDETNVTFFYDNYFGGGDITINLYYRIYYDG